MRPFLYGDVPGQVGEDLAQLRRVLGAVGLATGQVGDPAQRLGVGPQRRPGPASESATPESGGPDSVGARPSLTVRTLMGAGAIAAADQRNMRKPCESFRMRGTAAIRLSEKGASV